MADREMVRGVSGCPPEQKPIGTSRDLGEGGGQRGALLCQEEVDSPSPVWTRGLWTRGGTDLGFGQVWRTGEVCGVGMRPVVVQLREPGGSGRGSPVPTTGSRQTGLDPGWPTARTLDGSLTQVAQGCPPSLGCGGM